MNWIDRIAEKFPIRKSREEKAAFRSWVLEEAKAMGYDARVEENGGWKHKNIVIGNPAQAAAVFTAHYDTPAASFLPNIMMPRNLLLFFAYQFLQVGILLAVSFIGMLAVTALTQSPQASRVAFFLIYFGLLMLMLVGPANKHNVNDNTSGVAAVLALMESLPPEHRGKAAFILFDNEEKGKLGSGAYAKDHQQEAYTKFVVNMDCVGVGENILVISKKLAQKKIEFAPMKRAMEAQTERQVLFFNAESSVCNSDQSNFKCGVVLCACKKARVVGYYTPHIHTSKDTEADEGNIALIARGMTAFVTGLTE